MNSNLFTEDFNGLSSIRDQNYNRNSSVEAQLNNIVYISKVNHKTFASSMDNKMKNKDSTSNLKGQKSENIKALNLEDLIKQIQKDSTDDYLKYKEQLISCFESFDYSPESLYLAEEKIQEIIEKSTFDILGKILQDISLEYYDNKNILSGICQSLERFDLEEVYPWGATLMISILAHKDENIKAYAISCIDNWADESLLPVLRNIECSSDWMKSYISDVITRLEV